MNKDGFKDCFLKKCKISNYEKIEEYLEFCFKNKLTEKIKGKTELHHILSSSIFSEYSNLKENKWNGIHLEFKHHFEAHSLLALAISDKRMLIAWGLMNNYNYNGETNSLSNLDYKLLKEEYSIYLSNSVVAKKEGEETYRRISKKEFIKGNFKTAKDGMILVENKEGETLLVHKDIYHKNKHIYRSILGFKIPVYDKILNKNSSVNVEDFDRDRYTALSKNRVGALNSSGDRVITF